MATIYVKYKQTAHYTDNVDLQALAAWYLGEFGEQLDMTDKQEVYTQAVEYCAREMQPEPYTWDDAEENEDFWANCNDDCDRHCHTCMENDDE